jgi:hypothetical protein
MRRLPWARFWSICCATLECVPVLHIEHPITDLNTWLQAFNGFAPARQQAGVKAERIWQPEDDPHYIVVNLEFESSSAAANFRTFLQERVWSSPDASPGLAGSPRAVILSEVTTA